MNVLPLLVKGGAIIPTQPKVEYLFQAVDNYTVDIYPKGKSVFSVYDDDGKSLEYLKGNYSETKIECTDSKDKISVRFSSPIGVFKVSHRTYNLKIHVSAQPKGITYKSGKESATPKPIESRFDKETGVLYLSAVGNTGNSFEVTILK
jgi:alpha-glucosidase (family GH31 glycosyl hydrolase)